MVGSQAVQWQQSAVKGESESKRSGAVKVKQSGAVWSAKALSSARVKPGSAWWVRGQSVQSGECECVASARVSQGMQSSSQGIDFFFQGVGSPLSP